MKEDEFTRLFKYVEKRFDGMDERLNDVASKDGLNKLTNTLDNFLKRLDDNETEQAARDAQFDRLVEWAKLVSKKTGVPMPDL